MKKLLLIACVSGCSLFTPKNIKDALSVIQVACIIANAESDEAWVQKTCSVADDLIPDLKKVMTEQKAAARKYAKDTAQTCR